MADFFDNINWELLREQKALLVDLAQDNIHEVTLQGVINLLDALQDAAAEELDEFIVFGGQKCEGHHMLPPHAAHVLAWQGRRLMGTEPPRWVPICSDLVSEWWGSTGGKAEEERRKMDAPEQWLMPLEED